MDEIDTVETIDLSTLPHMRQRSKVHAPKYKSISHPIIDGALQLSGESAPVMLAGAVTCLIAKYQQSKTVSFVITDDSLSKQECVVSLPCDLMVRTVIEQIQGLLGNFAAEKQSFEASDVWGGIAVYRAGNLPEILQRDLYIAIDTQKQRLELTYDERLIEEGLIGQVARHLANLCQVSATAPSLPISQVEYVDQDEQASLLKLGSGGFPANRGSLFDLYLNAISEHSETTAIIFGSDTYTLGALDELASTICTNLQNEGLALGARIGIAIEPQPLQIALLLASLKLNAIIVPLDTSLPQSRLEQICEDARPDIYICDDSTYDRFIGQSPVVRIDALSRANSSDDGLQAPTVQADDPLYLLFTSGSTGRAKGVLMPHRTLANLVTHENQQRPVMGNRVLGRTSIAFDVGLQEVFSTILCGGTLVMLSSQERADVVNLPNFLSELYIDKLFLPPVALHQLAATYSTQPVPLPNLEYIVVAGERLQITGDLKRFFRNTKARLINQYGPTETHVVSEYCLSDRPLSWDEQPSIGKPLPGIQIYVADENGDISPQLVEGELVVSGVAVGLGYNPSDVVDINPFETGRIGEHAGMAYRTGDRAYWSLDGQLQFVGRNDEQIKIRGYRVELGDLETNASQLSFVHNAAAKYWETTDWSGLALYLNIPDAHNFTSRDVRRMLESQVPSYMLPSPSGIIILDELPLTASGKIDRQSLRCPSADQIDADADSIVLDELASKISAIWKEYLQINDLEPSDEFSDVGGDSLMAIQIVSEVNDNFNISVPLSTLLRGTSLSGFTRTTERLILKTNNSEVHPIEIPDLATDQSDGEYQSLSTVTCQFNWPRDPKSIALATLSEPEARHLWKEIFLEQAYQIDFNSFGQTATIIDIGANIGVFSMFVLERLPQASVFAVEPVAELIECLGRNLQIYGDRVTICETACGLKTLDFVPLTFFPNVPAMSSLYPDIEQDCNLLQQLVHNDDNRLSPAMDNNALRNLDELFAPVRRDCAVMTLADLIDRHALSKIDLLKIDVQRGEGQVLAGISGEKWQNIQRIIIEMQDHDHAVDKMKSNLDQHGYDVVCHQTEMHRDTNVFYVSASRR